MEITSEIAGLMGEEDVIRAKLDVTNKASDIKVELDAAKSKAFHSGQYSDPKWFRKKNNEYKSLTRKLRILEAELSLRKRRGRSERGHFQAVFHDIAKDVLGPEMYSMIAARANEVLREK